MIRLSKASKMPCRSWSLEALDTCAGSRDINGDLVAACQGCYATTGNYRFPNVKTPRVENKSDWKRDAWVDDMVKALDNDRYFRWFDSGDMYSLRLAWKIYEVMQLTPWVRHWLPTRMHKFSKFQTVLNMMRALPNVSVRASSDSVTGEFDDRHGSTIIPDAASAPDDVSVCEAYKNNGKCGDCRKCWSKDIPVIAYVAHGQKMKKVISIKAKG